MENWGNSNIEEVSTSQVDAAFDEYFTAREDYEAKKKISSAAHKVMGEAEWKLQELLESAGKTAWELSGKGKISSYDFISYKTPKTQEEKKLLAGYIQEKMGKEAFWDMFSVNAQTLNSWAKLEFEQGVKEIPGLQEPTTAKKLRLTRSKK